jgi:hypothetical protein
MLALCSEVEKKLLSNCIGKKLTRIVSYKYSNMPVYSQFSLQFSEWAITMDLRTVDLAPKFEVFVIQLSNNPHLEWPFGRDELTLDDFQIEEMEFIRRTESIGNNESGPVYEASVDAGLVLQSSIGTRIEFEADAFPLTFRFRFVADGSGEEERMERHFVPIIRSSSEA